jgi:uncharacterized protein YecE (DUF72 family)
MDGDVRIGTCGWSYPSGRGTWNGLFYPSAAARGRRRFDELAYYADHFDTVEVNSTFYRVPSVEMARSWAARTPAAFEFSVKLYQGFTHPAMAAGSAGSGTRRPAPGARDAETATERRTIGGSEDARAVPAVTQRDVDDFRKSIDPLAEAGKLGALLVQFPPSFKQSPRSVQYLDWLLRAFSGYSLAVELRDRTWSDTLETTLPLLGEFGAAWVQIDEPKFRFSVRQNRLPNVTGFYYMRLHGRNAQKWWRHDESEDRYDYLYSPEELRPFSETVKAVRTLVRKAYVYLNNHFAAKAVADAVELKHQLGAPVTGEYRPEMLAAYPFLQRIPACKPEPALLPPPS